MFYAMFFLLIYSRLQSYISHFLPQILPPKFNFFQTFFIQKSLILLNNNYYLFIFSLIIKKHQSFHSYFRSIEFPRFVVHLTTYFTTHWLVNQSKGFEYFMQFKFLYFTLINLKIDHFFQSHLIKDFNWIVVLIFYHCLFYYRYYLNRHHHHHRHLNRLSRINYHYHLENPPHFCFIIFLMISIYFN